MDSVLLTYTHGQPLYFLRNSISSLFKNSLLFLREGDIDMKYTTNYFIYKLIPAKVKQIIRNKDLEFINVAFSQEGEDLILGRYFEGKTNGFYIDIGAHHPKRFSNTYKFYL